jgi:uncharacterized membrane protein YcjF (UPF0283 family)
MNFALAFEIPQARTRRIVERAMAQAGAEVKQLKQRANAALEDLLRSMFDEIDMEKLRKELDQMRESAPDHAPAQHARTLARRTAIRCAAAGALSGLPLGGASIGALTADLAYLVFQQFRLVVAIATLYGHEPTGRERFSEALACLVYVSGVGLGKQGIAALLGSATVEGGVVAERLGARLARERLARIVPVVGMVSGSALNFAAIHAVARSAIRYYDSHVDPVLAEEIWAEGDREHA